MAKTSMKGSGLARSVTNEIPSGRISAGPVPRKNAARAVTPKAKLRRQYDDTLPSEREEDLDHRQLFKEMKKREF